MILHTLKSRIFRCLILSLFIYSCDYSPTETNFKSITPPQGNVDITVLDPGSINQLRGTVTFAVQTELNGHTVKDVVGFVDSIEVPLSLTNLSQVRFNTEYSPDGEHIFTLVLLASTNTGSLADLLGAEALISAKQYPVTIFNAPISKSKLLDFTVENGALTINWKKYEQLCFKGYELRRNGMGIATINDVNQTSFRDTTYFKGYADYEIVTKVLNYTLVSDNKMFQGVSPNFVSTSILPGEKVLVTWNKYPFTAAFGKYVITSLESEFEITSPDDTTFIDEQPPLGAGGIYLLKAYSKTGEETPDASIQGQPVGNPFEFEEGAILKYIPDKNLFVKIDYSFITYQRTISYHDGSTLDLLQSHVLNYSVNAWAISDNGDYIYYTDGQNVYKLNSTTLIEEEITDLMNIMPPGTYRYTAPVYDIEVNNNNQMSALVIDNHSHQILAFFDMNSKICLRTFQFNYGNYTERLKISDDQHHIVFAEHIYRYNAGSLTEIGNVYSYATAFTKDYSSIIVSYQDKIQILRSDDAQIMIEIPGTFYGFLCVDSKTGLFGTWGKIYDPTSGQLRGSIRVSGLTHYYLNGFYFVDGYYKYVELNL